MSSPCDLSLRGDHMEVHIAPPDDAVLTKETNMGLDDKIKNAAQDVAGKGKEATGKATDNERLEAEGQTDQTEASLKKAGENVKDAFK